MKFLAKEAQIQTAIVEIKIITISGKQVTLSVFRQLKEEFCFDENGNPLGILWGKVNYCPGKEQCGGFQWREYAKTNRRSYSCDDDNWIRKLEKVDHEHVIWQKGEELRRSAIFSSFYMTEDLREWVREQKTEEERKICKEIVQKDKENHQKMKAQVNVLNQLFIAV